MPDDSLTPEERAAVDALARDAVVPVDLEDRVVASLRRRGLRRRRWLSVLGYAAVAVAVFIAGVGTGRQIDRGPAPTGPRYLLLLYGAPAQSASETAARIAEYGAWAREERAAGRLLAAEKLTADRIVLGAAGAAPADATEPSGFFLIAAASMADAQVIASRCPHLRHGGTMVVRPLQDTR